MLRKLTDTAPRTSREMLADPTLGVPHERRLIETGAVDLRDNVVIEHEEGGYVTARPIDSTKRFAQ